MTTAEVHLMLQNSEVLSIIFQSISTEALKIFFNRIEIVVYFKRRGKCMAIP